LQADFCRNSPLRRANLVEILGQPGDFTFFAPTNNAFNALGQDLLTILFLDDEFLLHLEDLVLFHGSLGERFTNSFVNNEILSSFNSENIFVQRVPGLTINFNTIVQANIKASNDVTHVISEVLQPAWVSNSIFKFVSSMSELSILFELLVRADLNVRLDEFVVLTLAAPTNSAFEALNGLFLEPLRSPANRNLLIRILRYHFITGVLTLEKLAQNNSFSELAIKVETSVDDQNIKLNQATVIGLDILLANNGGLYKIDAVLNPDNPANGF
jgi:uncharacterized surface protein with fasciclin (FAS1) repeats